MKVAFLHFHRVLQAASCVQVVDWNRDLIPMWWRCAELEVSFIFSKVRIRAVGRFIP